MYRFDEGDKVKAGDTLVYLNTPEVLAKLQQAEAVQKAAEAQNASSIKGARAQEIAGAYRDVAEGAKQVWNCQKIIYPCSELI